MANPNIVNVTVIQGKVVGAVATTSAAALVTNAASSGKIIKINSITASNVSSGVPTITVDVYKGQSTAYRLTFGIPVPSGASLIILSKDTSIYLEENDSLRVTASANSSLEIVCSYEEIS
jgi:hypothetical protein